MKRRSLSLLALLCLTVIVCTGCNKIISREPPQTMSVIDYVDSTDTVFLYDPCIFPSDAGGDAVKDFYFMKNSSLLDDTIVLYEKCSFDSDAYEAEVDRISRIQYGWFDADDSFMRDDYTSTSEIKYNDSDFIHPAYVTVWRKGYCCSYALLDSDNQEITYVYLQYANRSDIKFDKSLLPGHFFRNISLGNLLGYLP